MKIDLKKIIPIIKVVLSSKSNTPTTDKISQTIAIDIAGDLAKFYGLDSNEGYILLQKSDLNNGINLESLEKAAQENYWKKVEANLKIMKTPFGALGAVTGHHLEASLIAIPLFWEKMQTVLGPEIVFMVPSKDMLMLTKLGENETIEKMKLISKKVQKQLEAERRMLLSQKVYLFKKGKISVLN